ncbi:MAG: FAD-dependent oxidoreductase, partial [Candidatus Omnitrophota bacterium]
LDKKREHLTNHLLFPLPSPVSKGILVIKTADGNPMIGPTAEDGRDKEDLATSDEGLRKVLAGAQRMIPALRQSDIIAYFAGLRPVARLRPGVSAKQGGRTRRVAGDDFIIRHEEIVPGLVTVAGIQSPGLTAAAAIALLVCNILSENGLSLKRKAVFHPRRKKTARLLGEPLARAKKLIKKDPAYGDMVCRCELVSAGEIRDAIQQGAKTLDGIKFRTRAQAGRCHGSFCATRIMKILSEATDVPLTKISKRGCGSEVVKEDRAGG